MKCQATGLRGQGGGKRRVKGRDGRLGGLKMVVLILRKLREAKKR